MSDCRCHPVWCCGWPPACSGCCRASGGLRCCSVSRAMSPKPANVATTPSATKRPAPPHATALRRPPATTHAPPRSVARWHPTNRRQMAPHKRHPLKGIFGAENAICTPQKAFSGETPFDRCHLQMPFARRLLETAPCPAARKRFHSEVISQKVPLEASKPSLTR